MYEDAGLSVQAMNDDANLYLLISAASREGRAQLGGKVGQPFTLWFLAPDAKTRTWGVRLPFDKHWAVAGDPGPEPEYVVASGPKVSTAPWPADVEFRYDISGRRPVYEARVPFARAPRADDGSIPLDVVISGRAAKNSGYRAVNDESRKDPWTGAGKPGEQRSRYASAAPRLDEVPLALDMFLKVRPAAAPRP